MGNKLSVVGPTTLLLLTAIFTTLLLLASLTIARLYASFFRFTHSASGRSAALRKLGLAAQSNGGKRRIAGFFHPYSNAGGGGERVLWAAIAHVQRTEPDTLCLVYTGREPGVTKASTVARVQARFRIELNPASLAFCWLDGRKWVEDSTWPRFTLLGQSLGSVWLAWEAVAVVVPDIFIDTMGYAFTYPLVSFLCRIPVGSYTHYPTISSEMLRRVQHRETSYANASAISKSLLLSSFKFLYYLSFSELYSLSLRQADVIMVNSSWTQNHVERMMRPFMHRDDDDDEWKAHLKWVSEGEGGGEGRARALGRRAEIVYPPCDVTELSGLKLEGRKPTILSLAQFRPEKDHRTQLLSFRAYLDRSDASRPSSKVVKLVMAGSVRGAEDEKRVAELKQLVEKLQLSDRVEFLVNADWSELHRLFGSCSIGLSTMIDEHFGINIVEFMAAGLIPVVHGSGGPLLDIVTPQDGLATGYHATSADAFAEAIEKVLSMSEEEQLAMRRRARLRARAFSTEEFEKGWQVAWAALWRCTTSSGSMGPS